MPNCRFLRLATTLCLVALPFGCDKTPAPSAPAADSPNVDAGTQVSPPQQPSAISGQNAAPEYRHIAATLDTFPESFAKMDLTAKLSEEQSMYLVGKQDQIREIIVATKLGHCDFGTKVVDFSTRMPHLVEVRKLVRLLQYDAQRLIHDPSKQTEAVDRLIAILGVARHSGAEPILISKMTSWSCVALATGSIKAWREQLTSAELRNNLQQELESTRNSSMFDLQGAMRTEFLTTKAHIEKSQGTIVIAGNSFPLTADDKQRGLTELEHLFAELERIINTADQNQVNALMDRLNVGPIRALVAGLSTVPNNRTRILSEIDTTVGTLR